MSYLKKFTENPQCPKCLSKDVEMRLVEGGVFVFEYVRWECLKCGYFEHMEPADLLTPPPRRNR